MLITGTDLTIKHDNQATNGRTLSRTSFQNRWGRLAQIHLPTSIVEGGKLRLNNSELTLLAVLFEKQKRKQSIKFRKPELLATVQVGQEELLRLTGYTRRAALTKGIKGLVDAGYIKRGPNHRTGRKSGPGKAVYIFLNPKTGNPLLNTRRGSVLFHNQLSFFLMPKVVISETEADWCVAKMKAREFRLYVALLFFGNRRGTNEFETSAIELKRLTDVTSVTFKGALEDLEDRGLVQTQELDKLKIRLCDPFTGEPLVIPDGNEENDPQNYTTTDGKGRSRRLNTNRNFPEAVRRLIQTHLPEGSPVIDKGRDLLVLCPFHNDRKPSLSVSPTKRCFHCFVCGQRGTLTSLIAKLLGSRAKAIKSIAGALEQAAEFREPDNTAIDIYYYKNRDGKLLKQVLRYPNDPSGKKVIKQRRPCPGGYEWNTGTLGPLLYNLEWLKVAGIVVICEGEKDAKKVNDLHLMSRGYMVVAVTSGGSSSWHASLAKELIGHQVIVLPDDDAPGEAYAEAVAKSLNSEGIEYRWVSFGGTQAMDASEYLDRHSVQEFVRFLGIDGATLADGTKIANADSEQQECEQDSLVMI